MESTLPSWRTPDPEQAAIDRAIAAVTARQDLRRAFNAGSLAATVTALLWAVVTVAGESQSSYMAWLVGIAVAWSVRTFGQGVELKYGILGAGLALYGCLLGNVLAAVGFAADSTGESALSLFLHLRLANIGGILLDWLDVYSVFFYGTAIYTGFKVSHRGLMDAVADYIDHETSTTAG